MFFGREISGNTEEPIQRVLVVEDEALVAFDNENFLVHAGYVVVGTVDSYDAAIGLIESEQIDLVIADVTLSGDKDGIAVAEFASARGVPVLFVTGACPINARSLAVGCLSKPYSQRDLLASIKVVNAVTRSKRVPRLPSGLSLFQTGPDQGEP
ncbi:MAG: response regulator [Sphingobium sp.]|uniref:response regulator n=1 Tax=Sphingobium sp. TaxID=1912891 RepID=UPI0029A1D6BA|nr:response regulator [Sphingobium sp.]MDX3910907.1 response regulator [Sphingobium sp.]